MFDLQPRVVQTRSKPRSDFFFFFGFFSSSGATLADSELTSQFKTSLIKEAEVERLPDRAHPGRVARIILHVGIRELSWINPICLERPKVVVAKESRESLLGESDTHRLLLPVLELSNRLNGGRFIVEPCLNNLKQNCSTSLCTALAWGLAAHSVDGRARNLKDLGEVSLREEFAFISDFLKSASS